MTIIITAADRRSVDFNVMELETVVKRWDRLGIWAQTRFCGPPAMKLIKENVCQTWYRNASELSLFFPTPTIFVKLKIKYKIEVVNVGHSVKTLKEIRSSLIVESIGSKGRSVI